MADTHKGYILLWRSITDWQWYTDVPVAHLYQHLLLTANHDDQPWRQIIIRRGQLVTSVNKLATETGLSTQEVRTALTKLESTNEITRTATNKYTLINIVKYANFQDSSQNTNKQKTSQPTNKQQTSNKQATNKQQTINEPTNNTQEYTKKYFRYSNTPAHAYAREEGLLIDGELYPPENNPFKPSLQDVKEFVAVKNLMVSPEEFYYRYDGMDWIVNGTPITNWQKLLMSWHFSNKQKADASKEARKEKTKTETGSRFADIFAQEAGGNQDGNTE